MSNTERETKEVQVGEHKLVINTYITGREARDIESVMMNKLEVGGLEGKPEIKGFNAEMLSDRQDLQVKAVIVSIDGVTENVVDAVLDLPSTESEEIMKYVLEITEPKKEEAGK